MIADGHVHLNQAHKTPQFWLIWIVLCMNVSAGIGIIGIASPMLQEIFGGALAGQPELNFDQVQESEGLAAQAALVAAGFVGLISLFNIFGRIVWASSSDKLGRKLTYYTFFTLGAICYLIAPFAAEWKNLALFVGAFCLIASMYGGGFATIPAYLADVFGTQFVGAIHGRLLTAWSTAGIVGPVIVNYMREARLADGVPRDQLYDPIFYVMVGLMVVGFIANLLIRPLHERWFMKPEEVEALQAADRKAAERVKSTAPARSSEGLDLKAVLAWAAVGIPLAWGIWITLEKALVLFR
jgi:MFS family permease